MIATEIATVGMTSDTEEQHLAQRHVEQTGQREGGHARHHQHDAAFQADGHAPSPSAAVPFLPICVARLRASGADMTSSTSRKMDCRAVAMVSDNA